MNKAVIGGTFFLLGGTAGLFTNQITSKFHKKYLSGFHARISEWDISVLKDENSMVISCESTKVKNLIQITNDDTFMTTAHKDGEYIITVDQEFDGLPDYGISRKTDKKVVIKSVNHNIISDR